ncbi:MAG: hypothetical protein M3144_11500 [Actinomycetota bacterium]|nr:hypothetical protein [Actinomycetota bacterium]
MLVLAADVKGCVGVDLDTGAFVRASHPPMDHPPRPFTVVSAHIAGAVEPPDAARPEALELEDSPKPVGRLSVKRAERLLAPLHHPPRLPILGLAANAVPYWTLSGDRPSVALLELRGDPLLRWGPFGPECHFAWQGSAHELPLADQRIIGAFESHGLIRPMKGDVQRFLGYRPRRLLVMLTAPIDGYCHKAVAALLPSARG